MGGIAVDHNKRKDSYLEGSDSGVWHLTRYGVELLAELDSTALDGLTTDYIQDKSKSSQLAKFLVTLQALWFITQCISRFSQGLPTSLLEVSRQHHMELEVLWRDIISNSDAA